jgi:hypothetical protein
MLRIAVVAGAACRVAIDTDGSFRGRALVVCVFRHLHFPTSFSRDFGNLRDVATPSFPGASFSVATIAVDLRTSKGSTP